MSIKVATRRALLAQTGEAAAQVELILQPDATAGLDTQLSMGQATTNYGTNQFINVGELNNASNATFRSLIKFDLSSIPPTATITSAVLSLYAESDFSDSARTMRVYRLKRAWVEAEATWNIYSTGNNWQTAGGFGTDDCEQTDIGSREFTATETLNVFKDFTLTASKVQEWVSGAFANNGMLLMMDTEFNDDYRFIASDHATAAQRPKLTINYTT